MRIVVRPPSRGNTYSRDLARAMGGLRLHFEGSRYRYREGDLVINWGNSHETDAIPSDAMVNHPRAIPNATNKLRTWRLLSEAGVPTVEWTRDIELAEGWLDDGQRLLVRTSLGGSRGNGITVYSSEGTAHSRPWSEYEPQDAAYVKVFGRNPQLVTEYRVHVVDGQVIDFVQKKRSRSYEGRHNPYVRSYRNGWIFARQGVELPAVAHDASARAVEALELDFGAVDIGVFEDRCCVYEVNTAPGIEGTTLRRYADTLGRRAE